MEVKKVAILVIVVGVLVSVIVLVATSLKKLSSKEIGLQYDTIWKSLDSEVYTEGLHTGPPGYEFIIFPNVYTTMSFSNLQCLNSDGVRINLDVSYQYRVRMDKVKNVVMQFKDFEGYQRILRNVGSAALHESCSYFDTVQFQTNRGEFQNSLAKILTLRYEVLNCEVEGLQVNNIERPREYENAIRSKERAREDIKVAKQERPRLITEANTTLREALSEAQIILDKAESEARILENLAKAEAKAIIEQYDKEAEAYEAVMGNDGLKFSPEGFIAYLGVRVIADAKNPVYIGLDAPVKTSYEKN